LKPKTKTVTDIMIVKIKNRPATLFGRSALVLVFALLCGNSLQAQTATPWSDLSQTEQQMLQQVRPDWESLSAEQQERLRRGRCALAANGT
jgi:hypothetical protein